MPLPLTIDVARLTPEERDQLADLIVAIQNRQRATAEADLPDNVRTLPR